MQIEERETKKRTEARESEGGRETVIRHVQKDSQTENQANGSWNWNCCRQKGDNIEINW